MSRLVESVPNFSEGRRLDIVDRLVAAVEQVPGAYVLDRTSDTSHNRSVLTLAGEEEAVSEAVERAVAVAVERIDLNVHRGEHPRIGAVDVIPFVPLGETTMADCVELARMFGEHLAERFGLPVYLYAEAAMTPDRYRLADIRRGEFEALRTEIASVGRRPDFGPAAIHPTAGAVAVGARPFLIAWNINLASSDLDLANAVARRIRESSGGFPKVQAKGFYIEELDCAQVSMNLLDFETTPIWRVWDAVRDAVADAGVRPAESELVGLAPLASLLAIADHAGADPRAPVETRLASAAAYVQLRGFSPMQALELRLAAVEAAEAEASTKAKPAR